MSLLSPDDLAKEFGVPVRTVMEWRRRYDWPCTEVGRRIRFTAEQFDEILRRHASGGGSKIEKPRGQTRLSAARNR